MNEGRFDRSTLISGDALGHWIDGKRATVRFYGRTNNLRLSTGKIAVTENEIALYDDTGSKIESILKDDVSLVGRITQGVSNFEKDRMFYLSLQNDVDIDIILSSAVEK